MSNTGKVKKEDNLLLVFLHYVVKMENIGACLWIK